MHSFESVLGQQKYDSMIQVMTERFGKEFLEEDKGHPLQLLWKRQDFIAEVELYYFSQCIANLLPANEAWVTRMIKIIKQGDAGNLRGDLFEVIALGMLSHQGNTVTPSANNNPGVDGLLELANGKKIRFSIKNYNLSVHQSIVNKKAKEIEELLTGMVKEWGLGPVSIRIAGNLDKPLNHHWDMLKGQAEFLLEELMGNGSVNHQLEDAWRIQMEPLQPAGEEPFSNKGQSYTFVLSTPLHPNENRNLVSRIQEGIDNLEKYGGDESDDILNFIWIQLPPTIAFNLNFEWARQYLDEHPESKVSGIMFYQPFFYNAPGGNEAFLVNPLKFVSTEKYAWLGLGKNPFPVDFPAGKQISDPPAKRYGISGQGLSPEDGLYIYQSGEHYYSVPIVERDHESITLELKMSMPDFGITRYNIIEVDDKNGVKLETNLHPPGDRLLII